MSTDANKAETVVAYAALILADEGLEITPGKLQTLLAAANIDDIEPVWTQLFAKALKDKDVKDILTTLPTSTREVGKAQITADGNSQKEPEQGEDKDGEGSGDEGSDDEAMFSLFG